MSAKTSTAAIQLPSGVPAAWLRLLRAHATLTRRMDANLQSAHKLTINDYEVLLALARAEDRRMRRVDLAGHVLLTQSGITRLLQGLERAGLVERAGCPTDGRVVYAQITDQGHERLRAASATHLDDIRSLFAARLSAAELDTLGELLGRVMPEDDSAAQCPVG
ncbi:MAG TPA: MarR family winged helix-turn-helix transcriptional regulator [Thermoleophilaceae bacterium]|nr:MarR family winged helix-turn-helix transcriptional regulator [Thermoleophilaceae bacterium]